MLDLGIRVQTTVTVCEIETGSLKQEVGKTVGLMPASYHNTNNDINVGAVMPSSISVFWD